MQGSYEIIGTFTQDKSRTELGEDRFQLFPDGEQYLLHEIGFSVAGVGPVWLRVTDIEDTIHVLTQAKDLAEKRMERFYAEHEAYSTLL